MFIPIGQDNFIERDRVVAVVPADSSPSKRLRRDAAEKSRLIDATGGRRTRSIIVLDDAHVVLCALQPDTLRARLDRKPGGERGRPPASEIGDPSET